MALVEVNWLKLNKDVKIPTKGTDRSAAYDFYCLEDVEIYPHQTKVIFSGLAWEPKVSMKDRDKRYKEFEKHGNEHPLVKDQMSILQELNEEVYSFNENNYIVKMDMSPRSSIFKQGIVISGKIDEDYRDEIGFIIHNSSNKTFKADKGDRLAQGEISLVPKVEFKEVKKLNTTKRSGGLGSTGK